MISLWPSRLPRKYRPLPDGPDAFRLGMSRMRAIVDQVAAEHGVSAAAIRGKKRTGKIARARQEAYARCYALREGRMDSPYSLPSIGRFFGRDHTTVLHGVKAHGARQG